MFYASGTLNVHIGRIDQKIIDARCDRFDIILSVFHIYVDI